MSGAGGAVGGANQSCYHARQAKSFIGRATSRVRIPAGGRREAGHSVSALTAWLGE